MNADAKFFYSLAIHYAFWCEVGISPFFTHSSLKAFLQFWCSISQLEATANTSIPVIPVYCGQGSQVGKLIIFKSFFYFFTVSYCLCDRIS